MTTGTTLAQGDIAIVEVNALTGTAPYENFTPGFEFVLLKSISGGTTISFTTNSFNSSGTVTSTQTGEIETVTWTAPSSGLSAGSVVTFTASSGYSGADTPSVGTSTGLVRLQAAGYRITAFQGTLGSNPTFLYTVAFNGINLTGASGDGYSYPYNTTDTAHPYWNVNGSVLNTAASQLPTALDNDEVAFSNTQTPNTFEGNEAPAAGGYYNGPTTGTAAALLADITNPANWKTEANYNEAAGVVSSFTLGPSAPTITSAAYDAGTGKLTVTGTNLTTSAGDYTVADLKITGESGGTYTLTSGSKVESSPTSTQFVVDLSATDQAGVDALLDKIGTTAKTSGTTFTLAAAADFDTNGAASSGTITVSDSGAGPSITESPLIASITTNQVTPVAIETGTATVYGSPDVAGIYAGGTFTAAITTGGDSAHDTLSIINTSGGITTSGTAIGSTVFYNGSSIGTIAATGAPGQALSVTLNASVTDAIVGALVKAVGISETGTTTSFSGRTVTFSATDMYGKHNGTTSAGVNVVPPRSIAGGAYDAGTGKLTLTGTSLTSSSSDYTLSDLTITNVRNVSYQLQSSAVISYFDSTGGVVVFQLGAADQSAIAAFGNDLSLSLSATAGFDTSESVTSNCVLGIADSGSGPSIGASGGTTVSISTSQGAPVAVETGSVTVTGSPDVAGIYAGGAFTASISTNDDVNHDELSIINTSGGITTSGTAMGSTVSDNGIVIGTVAKTGAPGQALSVTLNGSATDAHIAALVEAVGISESGTTASTAQRTVTFSVTDAYGKQNGTATAAVTVVAPPTIIAAEFDAGSGQLTIYGANLTSSIGDYTLSDVTIDAGQAGSYRLQSSDVISGLAPNLPFFVVQLGAAGQSAVAALYNSGANLTLSATAGFDTSASEASSSSFAISGFGNGPSIGASGGTTASISTNQSTPLAIETGTVTVTDSPDVAGIYGGGTFTASISANDDPGHDQLSIINTSGGITTSGTGTGSTISYNGVAIGTITATGAPNQPLSATLNGSATDASIAALVQAIGISESGTTTSTAQRQVTFDVANAYSQHGRTTAAVNVVPSISVGDVSQSDVNSGTTTFDFTVSLSAASTQTVTVNYTTADGTAKKSSDYQATSGTLTFSPGQTSQQVPVTVNGGTLTAPTENFSLDLSSPVNATIATGTGTGTIEDLPPTVSTGNVVVSGGMGTNGAFKIGDTVTATWSTDDPTVTRVTMDFSQFGGSSISQATNIGGGSWIASYTVGPGNIDTTSAEVAVTATDKATVSVTGSSGAVTVDNVVPTIAITTPIAGDNIINQAEASTVTIVGTTTGVELNQVVTVTLVNAANGSSVLGQGLVASNGAWSIVARFQGDSDGAYTIKADVSDAVGNAASEASQAITVDTTPPTVSSIAAVQALTNDASSEQFAVTFSEPVTGVVATDFALTTTNTPNGTALTTGGITSITTSGNFHYTVTVSSVAGDGTLRLDLEANDSGIADTAGNPATAAFTSGATYTIEHTPPSVTSITTVGSSPNNATSDQFGVTFSEAVTGVVASDFNLTTTNTPGGAALTTGGITSITTTDNIHYTVTVGSVAGDGTLRLDLRPNDTGITDAAGNGTTAAFTSGPAYTVDNTAPSIAGVTLDNSAYKPGDTVTATIALSGTYDGNGPYTLGANSTIDGAALTAGAYDSAANTLTATFVVGAGTNEVIAGNPTVDVTVDDAVGNPSAADTTAIKATTTIDTHVPTAVQVTGFTNGATDTGYSLLAPGSTVGALSTTDASGPTDTQTYTLTGTDANDFAVTNGALTVKSGVTLSAGTVYSLNVVSTDLGGNSFAQPVQVTGAIPPTVTSIDRASATALTNASSDSFVVTFSSAVAGVAAANFTLSGTDGTGTIGTPVASNGGTTWTVPVTGVSGNGTLGLDLTQTNGITGTTAAADGATLAATRASDQTYTIDTTPPTLAITTPIAGDNTINKAEAAAGFSLVGTTDAEDGQTVTVTLVNASSTAVGTYTDGVSNGSWSINVAPANAQALADGSYTVEANVSDKAGNPATEATQAITVDETPPTISSEGASPAGADLDAGKVVTFTIVASEAVNTSTSVLSLSNGAKAAYASGSGTSTLTYTYTVASGDTNTTDLKATSLTGSITDNAGNALADTSFTTIDTHDQIDTMAPGSPTLVSGKKRRFTTSTPSFTGTAEAGSTVTLYDGSRVVGSTVAAADGTYAITSVPFKNGTHDLTANATDAAGNVSAAFTPDEIIIDVKLPHTPTGPGLTAASNTGTTRDDITAIADPTFTGSAQPGTAITLYDGKVVVGQAVTGADGTYAVTSSTLSDGPHELAVTATDAAGNVSGLSQRREVIIDTATRGTPSAPVLVSDTGVSSQDDITKDPRPVIAGRAEGRSIITLYDGTREIGRTRTADDGFYKFETPRLGDGTHALTVTATDVAGIVSAPSAARVIVVDTQPPAVSITTPGGTTTGRAQALTGLGEPGSTITIVDNHHAIGTTAVGQDGGWMAQITLAHGGNRLVARDTDAAGNVGTSPAINLRIQAASAASLHSLVQAMATAPSTSASTMTPVAPSASNESHPLAIAH